MRMHESLPPKLTVYPGTNLVLMKHAFGVFIDWLNFFLSKEVLFELKLGVLAPHFFLLITMPFRIYK